METYIAESADGSGYVLKTKRHYSVGALELQGVEMPIPCKHSPRFKICVFATHADAVKAMEFMKTLPEFEDLDNTLVQRANL